MTWILFLNDMRASQIEVLLPVCQAETMEDLQAFIEAEKCEPYSEDHWGKTYRKDGPLEWCNPPWEGDEYRHFQQVPPQVCIGGCVEYSNPNVLLPTVEGLLSGFPPYNRLQRIKNEP